MPATPARPPTRQRRQSRPRRRPDLSAHGASTPGAARQPPTNPATATPARSRVPPGRRPASTANALSFNGTNASVSVPDSNSLDLTTGMTLEGWVRPAAGGGLADADRQGTARRPRLRALRQHRPEQAAVPGHGRGHRAPARRDGRRPGRVVDASGRHVRRHHPAPLRQRRPGRRRSPSRARSRPRPRRSRSAATRSGASGSTA